MIKKKGTNKNSEILGKKMYDKSIEFKKKKELWRNREEQISFSSNEKWKKKIFKNIFDNNKDNNNNNEEKIYPQIIIKVSDKKSKNKEMNKKERIEKNEKDKNWNLLQQKLWIV